ncbi:MAG TPA: YkgJ family cysteine cluster protein [Polyangiaceae bacterium]|nr:YkgJ family cysteine cluster protein [Polyangiaceae bacterium]
MATGERFFKFRCTGCGNCCKDPLLPLTDQDVLRIQQRTGNDPRSFVRWVDRNGIDMDDEPEAFVKLRPGKRVMVMRQGRGGCHFLGADDRCTIYGSRPLGCRIFPFDPSYTKQGKLRRLKLIQATDCQYELDGANEPDAVQDLHTRHEGATQRYQERIAEWNKEQTRRARQGRAVQTATDFLSFLGVI